MAQVGSILSRVFPNLTPAPLSPADEPTGPQRTTHGALICQNPQCLHTWFQRQITNPTRCPACGSRHWYDPNYWGQLKLLTSQSA